MPSFLNPLLQSGSSIVTPYSVYYTILEPRFYRLQKGLLPEEVHHFSSACLVAEDFLSASIRVLRSSSVI